VKSPNANVIKLPNISASVPQLVAAVKELQAKGYAIPDYPQDPATDAEIAIRARFDAIKGSAVNPILREGNSDRRAAVAVKNYAMSNPHSMGAWAPDSKTIVSTMSGNDFFSNEKSVTLSAEQAGDARIELVGADGSVTVLKDKVSYTAGTVVDATFMSAKALDAFFGGTDHADERRGDFILDPPEGHDDEGVRPDHLWSRGQSVFAAGLRYLWPDIGRSGHQPQFGPWCFVGPSRQLATRR